MASDYANEVYIPSYVRSAPSKISLSDTSTAATEVEVSPTGSTGHVADAHGADAHGADAHGADAHVADAHGADAHPSTVFWATRKTEELERAKMAGSYKPGNKATEKQMGLATLELKRRLEQDTVLHYPWVLVATQCKEIPSNNKVQNAVLFANSPSIGTLSFFLANDKCLYIISFSDKDRHGSGIEILMEAMITFRKGFPFFSCHTNVIAEVDGGRTAPDGALKMLFPVREEEDVLLRAPFIAEIHSSGKSVAGSLRFASTYMRVPVADYFLYIHAYEKREDRTFAAVAILWRRGHPSPLGDGQMAHLVTAQSFGTAELQQESIDALVLDHDHLPGVPANQLARQNPVNIVVPRAELLRSVEDIEGTPVLAQAEDVDGNPAYDVNGELSFVTPEGPDLVVDLIQLQRRLIIL